MGGNTPATEVIFNQRNLRTYLLNETGGGGAGQGATTERKHLSGLTDASR